MASYISQSKFQSQYHGQNALHNLTIATSPISPPTILPFTHLATDTSALLAVASLSVRLLFPLSENTGLLNLSWYSPSFYTGICSRIPFREVTFSEASHKPHHELLISLLPYPTRWSVSATSMPAPQEQRLSFVSGTSPVLKPSPVQPRYSILVE